MRLPLTLDELSRQERQALWRLLGLLSVASGGALLLAPLKLAALYGLPRSVMLARLIGIRDIAIGLGILKRRDSKSLFMTARGASDALDALLIGLEGARTSRRWTTVMRIPVALAASGLAWSLARRGLGPRD